jgi:hypothetical protein
MTPDVGTAEARRRKAHMLVKEIGLSPEDRIDLASMLLRRTVASWKELDEAQYIRILDALEGYQLISHLVETRQPHSPKNSTIVS